VREYANLVDEVLIVGVLDHIELWNPDIYNQMVSSAEAIFKQGRN
jgi:DNA-binding transcriptional regulator/RsmH inhibitor MraZ